MKRLACLLIASCLVLGILLIAVADVNHGHGPGYHAEHGDGGHGQSEHHDDGGHGGEAHGDDAHSNDRHGPPAVYSHF